MTSTRQIEQMLAARNVRGLSRAVGDRNVVISRRAAQALGELRDPAGVSALGKALQSSKDEFVRHYAIEALRLIGDPSAVDALTIALFSADRRVTALAQQALMSIGTPQALAAVSVRDVLTRNDYAALQPLGTDALRPLSALLNSDLYGTWPSGKRSEVLNHAVRLGATPPARYRKELAAAGVFVSGIHSVADLLSGLGNRNAAIRAAAAEKLGTAGVGWTIRPLFNRFRKEVGPGGDHAVAVAIARAMARLGDARPISIYRQQLVAGEGRQAAEAARALADIGLHETFEALFWFVASPPPPPGYRNVPIVLSALDSAGAKAVDQLKPLFTHDKPNVRRLMIDILTRCGHPEIIDLLSQLARDEVQEVQRAALDALAHLNSEVAADALFDLAADVPRDWVLRALAVITHPAGPSRLRELDDRITLVQGIVLEDRLPMGTARVQFVQEHLPTGAMNHIWQPISARAETDPEGAFSLSLFAFSPDQLVRLKVTTPIKTNGKGGETYLADFPLVGGKVNQLQAKLDRFFNRLLIETQPIPEEE